MKRLPVVLGLCGLLVLAGCGSTTSTIEGQAEGIRADRLTVNCSDEVNKGVKGNINDVGYICNIEITDQTPLWDGVGKKLSMEEIPIQSTVRVKLSKAVKLRKAILGGKSPALTAKEVILLSRKTITKEEIIDALEQRGLEVKEVAVNPDNFFHMKLRGISPSVYEVNGETMTMYRFSSPQDPAEGMAEFLDHTAAVDLIPFKNYDIDSFLLFFVYGSNLNNETANRIQLALEELKRFG